MRYDVAVVGLGLIGAAAVRHVSTTGVSVVGVGPAEPSDPASHDGPFASHYDSGRVTRRLDARFEWAVLAVRSIEQYPVLEPATGMTFHHPVGFLFVRNDADGVQHQQDVIKRLHLPVTVGTTTGSSGEFAFPSGFTTLFEPGPAGFIDPRVMLEAQLSMASTHGAVVRRTVVQALERADGGWRIGCTDGTELEAGAVLVATGPYLDDLLPERLAAEVMPEAVILAEVSAAEAERLSGMPSLVYLPDSPIHDDIYIVPPTRYPDGRWYLKMGGSHAEAQPLDSVEEKRAWMAGTEADGQLDPMRTMLIEVLPRVAFERFVMKPCLITDTAHGLPYVDEIDDGLFVAVGGNGHSAKSADAIGALVAGLVTTGKWNDTELSRDAFRAVFGEWRSDEGSRHGI